MFWLKGYGLFSLNPLLPASIAVAVSCNSDIHCRMTQRHLLAL